MTAKAQGEYHSYTENDVQRFLREGEGMTVEFKVGAPEPNVLARLIGGFANTSGGVILLGIEDRGEIVGCDIARANRNYRAALELLSTIPDTEFHDVRIANKAIALIEVAKSDGPVLVNGGAYVRVGSQTQVMTSAEMLLLFERAKRPSHTLESLAEGITQQTQIIEKLRQELLESGSFKNRIKEWLISGVIGAVLGWVVTKILGA